MGEKLKTEAELFTLSLCEDCNNAPIGMSYVAKNKTINAPNDITTFGIIHTYNIPNIDGVKMIYQICDYLAPDRDKVHRVYLGNGDFGEWAEWT